MTPDGVAIVGKLKNVEGFYLGIGMCGQGLMMGIGVGLNLTNLITKGYPLAIQGNTERGYKGSPQTNRRKY